MAFTEMTLFRRHSLRLNPINVRFGPSMGCPLNWLSPLNGPSPLTGPTEPLSPGLNLLAVPTPPRRNTSRWLLSKV